MSTDNERRELNRRAGRVCFMAMFLAKQKMYDEYRGDLRSIHARAVLIKTYHHFKREIIRRGL